MLRLLVWSAVIAAVPGSICEAQDRRAWSHEVRAWSAAEGVVRGAHEGEPFTELLPAWWVEGPADAAARLEVRVGDGREWSAWLTIAEHGQGLDSSALRRDGDVRIDVDVLVSEQPCTHAEWRVLTPEDSPLTVRGVWVTSTAESDAGSDDIRESEPSRATHLWDVPFRAQAEAGEGLAGRVCSPASVAMVMAAHGSEAALAEIAAEAFDPEFDLYGNWVRNTATAFRRGVPLIATRLGSWEAAAAALERGPIVISLPAFDVAALPEAGYSSASGHLLVLRGLDGAGNALVVDPAYGTREEAEREYPLERLGELWLEQKKGTAYITPERWGRAVSGEGPNAR